MTDARLRRLTLVDGIRITPCAPVRVSAAAAVTDTDGGGTSFDCRRGLSVLNLARLPRFVDVLLPLRERRLGKGTSVAWINCGGRIGLGTHGVRNEYVGTVSSSISVGSFVKAGLDVGALSALRGDRVCFRYIVAPLRRRRRPGEGNCLTICLPSAAVG